MTTAANTSQDEAAIRALQDRFVAALSAGDLDAMMKSYVPDDSFVILDVVPRDGYRGAETYRKNWEEFFTHFKGNPTMTYTELVITADETVAFSYCFMHLTGTDTQGQPIKRTVRVTDGYRKIGGEWLIALEHVSVPVDVRAGK